MSEESRSHHIEYVAFDSWHVVVDTSALLGTGSRKDADFRLTRPATLTFLQKTRPPIFYLSVPFVVVIEMVNHFREELPAASDRLDTALRDIGQLLGKTITADMSKYEPSLQTDIYEAWFVQELERNGARIEPLPEPLRGTEKLIRDELAGRKPFGERRRSGGNRGERSSMRDALIWTSTLELCRRERRSLAFITGNTSDFADDSNLGLHPDLLNTFEDIREGRQDVRLYTSIKAFIEDPPASLMPDAPRVPAQSTGREDETVTPSDAAAQ